MKKILYFGYGANREEKMLKWITGKSGFVGKSATLNGYILCIQTLDQVPQVIIPTSSGPQNLREHIRSEWGNKFETYVATPGDGKIKGTLWELEEEDRELIRQWERVGYWYKEVQVKVITDDGKEIKAITECLGDNQSFARKVDGLNYNPFLFPKEIFKVRAEQTRTGYYKRMRSSRSLI